jgi:hypothetical protein
MVRDLTVPSGGGKTGGRPAGSLGSRSDEIGDRVEETP